jgi:Tfp pilus assembly PilM family ATPase
MKIITLTAEQLELKEGGTAGIIVGAALIVAGVLAGIFLRGSAPFAIWIALGLAVAGILVILFSSSITLDANKRSGQLRYQKKRIVGTQDLMYSIGDVFRIETRKEWRMQNAPNTGNQGQQQMQQPVLVSQSVIVFKDGKELALSHEKTSSTMSVGAVSMMSGQGSQSAMAAQVAQFLNVPFEEIAPPNMGSGMNINIGGY